MCVASLPLIVSWRWRVGEDPGQIVDWIASIRRRRCCCGCHASDRLRVRVHGDAGEVVPDDLVNCGQTEKESRRCWLVSGQLCVINVIALDSKDIMWQLTVFNTLKTVRFLQNSDNVSRGCSNLERDCKPSEAVRQIIRIIEWELNDYNSWIRTFVREEHNQCHDSFYIMGGPEQQRMDGVWSATS